MIRTSDHKLAGRWAAFYVRAGYNPLPSDGRKPLLPRWTRFRREAIPAKWPGKWWGPSIQVVTGTRWRLAVVDIDGLDGLRAWQAMTAFRSLAPTWTVAHCGSDDTDTSFGMHLWFTIPSSLPSLRSRLLWGIWQFTDGRGAWAKRSGVELIGDGKQVVAPPSIHWQSRQRYTFLPGLGPNDLRRPALLPDWLIAAPEFSRPARPAPPLPRLPRKPARLPVGRSYDRRSVVDCVPDKIALAARWGVRFASTRVNPAGWVPCHSIFRPDRHPSASFSPSTGCYWESQFGRRPISLFDLAEIMHVYPSWHDAVNSLGAQYHAVPRS